MSDDKYQKHLCGLCGEAMPPGEAMFNFHGYSGSCPKPPLPPTRFRKKPVVIEAFQMTPERRKSNRDWPAWLNLAWNGERYQSGSVSCENYPNSDGTDRLVIWTLEGKFLVEWNDWIIQGVKGELYPCKPDIFEATYEAVVEPIMSELVVEKPELPFDPHRPSDPETMTG